MRSTDYNRNDLQSVLTYMRNQFGAGVFEEPSRMVSILLDLAPGLKRDGNVLRQMSEKGLLRELRTASESGAEYDRIRLTAKSRLWLTDYLQLSDERADFYITALQAAYGLKVELPKPPDPPPPPPKPVEPQKYVTSIIRQSGTDGNLIWSLDNDGNLKISGSGAMNVYGYDVKLGRINVPWRYYSEHILSVAISNGVTSIGDNAFRYCERLSSVTIPDSVTSIGKYAFAWCPKLLSISIPEKAVYETNAFDWNTTVMRRKAPPPPPKSTPKPQLIAPPKPVKSGREGSLTWTLDANGVLTISGKGPWDGKGGAWILHSDLIKRVVIQHGITSIGDMMLMCLKNLVSVQIPDTVTFIGNHAFSGCSSLESISIPDRVTFIGTEAFAHCENLTSIYIPESVVSIAKKAFIWCENLTSVEIPNAVTSIEEETFSSCKSLKSVKIPNSVTSIKKSAFSDCSSLAGIYIPDSVTSIEESAFIFCQNLNIVHISNSITSIEKNTFWACKNLHRVMIPNNVTSIGNRAFFGCTSLTDVHIPDSLTSIKAEAFKGCTNLNSITIPAKATIEKGAFDEHTHIKRVGWIKWLLGGTN